MVPPVIHDAPPSNDLLLAEGHWTSNGPQGLFVRRAALRPGAGVEEPLAAEVRRYNSARAVRAWVAAADAGAAERAAGVRGDLEKLTRHLRSEQRPCALLRGPADAANHSCPDCRRAPGYSPAVILPILDVPIGVALLCRAIQDCTGEAVAVAATVDSAVSGQSKLLALVTPEWVFFQMQVRPFGPMLPPYDGWVIGGAAAQVVARG